MQIQHIHHIGDFGADTFFMVRRMRAEDVDKTAKIWLEGNLSAHSFIPETYWCENYEGVNHKRQWPSYFHNIHVKSVSDISLCKNPSEKEYEMVWQA